MTEQEEDQLELVVGQVRRRLLKTGELRRQQVRRALRKDRRHLADEAAEVLVDEELAVKVPAQHGSWVLQLVSHKPEQVEPVKEATPYDRCTDLQGVLYKLADHLLHDCCGDGVANYDRAFVAVRQALDRLQLLRQAELDQLAERVLRQRLNSRASLGLSVPTRSRQFDDGQARPPDDPTGSGSGGEVAAVNN